MSSQNSVIPVTHPAMPGHFPGHPVVPGVVILDEVMQCLSKLHPSANCTGVRKMKFLAPLQPGQAFEISFGELSETSIRFSVTSGELKVANGRLAIDVE